MGTILGHSPASPTFPASRSFASPHLPVFSTLYAHPQQRPALLPVLSLRMTTALTDPAPPAPLTRRPADPGLAIDLTDVAKTYGQKVHALRGVAMQVHRGEIFGLLGPNGAGKSTLVKILTTVISPTRCQGTVLGNPVGHKPTLARIGYLPEHHRFPEYLSGRQVLEYFAALSLVSRRERKQRASELLDLVGMTRWEHMKVRKYSKGMRQRIGVAQALMMNPDLVILDEPTDGVDPVGRRDIRNILLEQRRLGKAVFVNSHLLSELEVVSDRCAIMVQGKVWAQGTVDELTSDGIRYEIQVRLPAGAAEDHLATTLSRVFAGNVSLPLQFNSSSSTAASTLPPPANLATPSTPNAPPAPPPLAGTLALPGRGSSLPLFVTPSTVSVETTDPADAQPVLDALRAAGLVVSSFRESRPSLEDLFMKAVTDPSTGKTLGPGAAENSKNGGAK